MSDLISRQAAIDTLAEMYCKSDEDGYVWIVRSDAWSRIDALPTIDPVKHGKWVRNVIMGMEYVYCSECEDTDWPLPLDVNMNYCPNCGANMDEVVE